MKRLPWHCLAVCVVAICVCAVPAHAGSLRSSVVSYHMSFDNRDFFEQDFIEISGKKSIDDRKLDFPEGRFGKGIRMSFVPAPPDDHNMTGIDLDLVTAVMFNTRPGNKMGYNQPFVWGSGRLNTRLGSVAFWAKGSPPYDVPLFEQTSAAFGRKERDLMGILVSGDGELSAYLRDARYVRHEISADTRWSNDAWNHIVLNWDWAEGLELWLNGELIASSKGSDGWFETLPPGLFHLPAPGLVYDELYLMDRPLTKKEIGRLMKSNNPPKDDDTVYSRKSCDLPRISKLSGADKNERLPGAVPEERLVVREVWPTGASDGHVPGWYVIDGRNEMAWPHSYAFFTIIPGDADFHAEKVDLTTADDSRVNYVTLAGNLTNVRVQSGPPCMSETSDLFSVPGGERFTYGAMVNATQGDTFRIPFTESYGPPEDFEGDVVRLPQSGEKRIHNVGLYNVSQTTDKPAGEPHFISAGDIDFSERYSFAVHALTSRDERNFAEASPNRRGGKKTLDIGCFRRLNIMSEPFNTPTGVTEMTLCLPIRTRETSETLFVRVHDPAVPSRLWNQFTIRLDGFNVRNKVLSLTIDCQDLALTGGDRLWIDVGTAGKTDIRIGDKKNPAVLYIAQAPAYTTVDDWAGKEIIPARAQYSKMYEFLPWQFTGRDVSLDSPYCYGGPFDVILPALAIKRLKPDHFIANFMELMSGPDYDDGHPIHPEKHPLVTINDPNGAPDWAVYMRDFNRKRYAIADWWCERQNPDGQMGGGWNDDTLFLSFHQADLPLDGHEKGRALIDSVHTKFEKTGLFRDGYCRIHPIDRMHTGDFISERYNTVVNNLGQAYAAEREMESAHRLGRPELTPVNYAQGLAFKTSVNVFKWYWGEDVPKEPYVSKPLDELTADFRQYTSLLDDFYFFRMTDSHVHRDDYIPRGARRMYTYMLGGERGARWDAHLKLAVMWPSGGGRDVSRVILRADDTSLRAVCYSFHERTRDLAMRLCRINDGVYSIRLHEDRDGNGTPGAVLWEKTMTLRRFDVATIPVPPKTATVIVVEQVDAMPRPAALPDFAIDPWDAGRSGSTVTTTVHNLGNAAADDVRVVLYDGDNAVAEKTILHIDAPTDFVARKTTVVFTGVPVSRNLRVVVDPDHLIDEILRENNQATVR